MSGLNPNDPIDGCALALLEAGIVVLESRVVWFVVVVVVVGLVVG